MNLYNILKERNKGESVDFAISTNYFGFGSLKALYNAHINNYNN